MADILLLAIIIAVISPFVWGLMNIFDKYVVSRKTKKPLSFALVAGLVNLTIGILLALFLDWSMITNFREILFPALAGVILGSQIYSYYYLLSKEDVSNIIGLIYLYPIIVSILSYFFLGEKLSLFGYVGMGIILLGAVLLSLRMSKFKFKVGIWMITIMILITAVYEFVVKIATSNLPELNGIAITHTFLGITVSLGFFNKNIRKNFIRELKNTTWAVLSESLTFLGVITTYFAVARMPVTIFAALASTQPLAVLILEKLFAAFGVKMSKDEKLMPKLIAISLIVVGVIILSLAEF